MDEEMVRTANTYYLKRLRNSMCETLSPMLIERFNDMHMLCLKADMLLDRMFDEDYFRYQELYDKVCELLQNDEWLYMGYDAFAWYTNKIKVVIRKANTAIEERWE